MDKTKVLIVEANKFLNLLHNNASNKEEKLQWFMDLISHIANIFKHLKKLQNNGTIKNCEMAMVYIQQMMSILSFLIKIFVKEMESGKIYLEARFYSINKIQFCLKGFQEDLLETRQNDEDDLLGSFIRLVDYALEKIGEIQDADSDSNELLEIYTDAKFIFSEIMTHAMIVAQIALDEDKKMIEGSCRSVIEALDWVLKEINSRNRAMRNLAVQACSEKICVLERRVNSSVLELTLTVFSRYTEIISSIQEYCSDMSNVEKPVGEFASLVEQHDFQVDRLLQIGLFAVSCSNDKSNAVKIRSCLSILESLDSELIPSFANILKNQTQDSMELALLFKDLWIREVGRLEDLIFRVVDPFAFCQLVYNINKVLLSDYHQALHKVECPRASANFDKYLVLNNTEYVKTIIAHTRLLLLVLGTIEDDEKNEFFLKAYQDLTKVFNEVKWAFVILKDKRDVDTHRKIWKRCKILQKIIGTIKHNIQHEEYASDGLEESLLNSPNNAKDPVNENTFLCHIINRGREILKDRTNIYSNSQTNESFKAIQKITKKKMHDVKRCNKEVPLSKYLHIRKLNFFNLRDSSILSGNGPLPTSSTSSASPANNSEATNYGELEISDIIQELNNLTATFLDITGTK